MNLGLLLTSSLYFVEYYPSYLTEMEMNVIEVKAQLVSAQMLGYMKSMEETWLENGVVS